VFFGYVAGIEPRNRKKALTIGTAYHAGLEAWRRTGDEAQAMAAVDNALVLAIAEGLEVYSIAQAQAYVAGYIRAFPEGPFADDFIERPIFDESSDDGGTADAVAHVDGELWIIEDKTVASFVDDASMALGLRYNDQIATYYHGLKTQGVEVQGVMYRQVKKTLTRRTQKETTAQYAERIRGIYTSNLDNYREVSVTWEGSEIEWLARQREAENSAIMAQLDKRDLEDWPINCNSCIGPYGPCEFLRVCHTQNDSTFEMNFNSERALDGGRFIRKLWSEACSKQVSGKD
jgi:hypothetical protein